MVSRWRGVVGVRWGGGVFDPLEDFRSDARGGADISVMAAVDEGKAEVDVFLLVEGQAAEDEGAAVEAGHFKSLSVKAK